MEDWQKRVGSEHFELAVRIAKLKDFINHPNFKQMVPEELDRELMIGQLASMCSYASFLQARMSRWEKK